MRVFFTFVCVFVLIFSFFTYTFADEVKVEDDPIVTEYEELDNPISDYTKPDIDFDVPFIPAGSTDLSIEAISPITPSDTSGLKSALLSILGNYDPVVVEYSYQNSNGYLSYLREIQPDYVWIWSCILLVVVIFCLFRLLGGLFNAKR